MASGIAQSTGPQGAAAQTAAAAGSSRTTIAQNFDAFLLLLTTQLKNQSPLDPLDTNQFTQQLVQFASVEQQLKSNETLNALLTSTRAASAATAASFVGMQVTADGATTRLSGGKAAWTLSAARDTQATITIKDASGSTVLTRTQALKAGSQPFAWDGRTSTGGLAPDGDYTIAISAKDATGQAVTVKTEIAGEVEGVDMSGGSPVLLIGSRQVPLASVRTIAR